MTKSSQTRVLIVGGGFGGVKAALELAGSERFAITLLSDRPDFRYYPTLYHTAVGGQLAQSSIPLATILEGKPIRLALGTAKTLNRKKREIITEDGVRYGFDILILGIGVVTNYFGIPGMAEFSYNIKTPEGAKRFKNHLHQQLTEARRPDHHYVVVGGGPTGIELAGMLPGYIKDIMKAHGVKNKAVHIDLVEAGPRLLPRMHPSISKAVSRRLRSLGVRLYLGKVVQGETADTLLVDGKPIQSHTVVWTAGVANHPFFLENNFALTERRKVVVDQLLQAEEDIFVIGDNADTQFSGMAQTALYDGAFVAHNIMRYADGENPHAYVPREPVYVIPAGPNWAAVQWGKLRLFGWMGWLLRSAADLRAFADYEPWWRAGKQWLTEFDTEEECTVCDNHHNR